MDHFRLLEHTADIGIAAQADSREGLAEQCGLGLRSLLYGDSRSGTTYRMQVSARGGDAEESLVNWLNELLFAMTERELVPTAIRVRDFVGTEIIAEVQGDRYNPEQHEMTREIKAVTHHQASVMRDGQTWRARVYLDL